MSGRKEQKKQGTLAKDHSEDEPAPEEPERVLVTAELSGERLDRAAARLLSDYSRTQLRGWIEQGALQLDGAAARPRQPVFEGQLLELLPPADAFENWHEGQPVQFGLVYEDDDLLVVDKPPGVVVHPGAGNRDRTLVNGLLAHRPALAAVRRHGRHLAVREPASSTASTKILRACWSLPQRPPVDSA